ncbi:MAG: hypothetical protein L0312_29765, partial [Acidobacteria bacterium]|nr:hypothetical protein [Acidobacteriota bacterium]
MARRNRITNSLGIEPVGSFTHLKPDSWPRVHCDPVPAVACAFVVAFLLCLGSVHGWAQESKQKQAPQDKQTQAAQSKQPKAPQSSQPQAQQNDQKQMRGLDEQIQEIKSDVLSISAELRGLEEKLLYPSGTQVAVFVSLTKGDTM